MVRLMEDMPLAIRDRGLHRVEAACELAELVGRAHIDRFRVHALAHSPAPATKCCTGLVTLFASQNEPPIASSNDMLVIVSRILRMLRYDAVASSIDSCKAT